MRSALPLLRTATLLLFLAAVPSAVQAQYMYLDANGDGVNDSSDRLNAVGNTTIDVWLNTSRDRNGHRAICSSDSLAPMTISTYFFNLQAVGGTINWGGYTNNQTGMTSSFEVGSTPTQYDNGFGGTDLLPPGRYKLGSLTVSIASGIPAINIVGINAGVPDYTGFGSECAGSNFDSFLALGTDWTDTDGIMSPDQTPDHPPLVAAPAVVAVQDGSPLRFTVMASDPDGDAITSLTAVAGSVPSGATFSVGAGNTSGTFFWVPGLSNILGVTRTVVFTASNALASALASTVIAVFPANAGTVGMLDWIPQPSDQGQTYAVSFTATDADEESSSASTTVNVGDAASAPPLRSAKISNSTTVPPIVIAPVSVNAAVGQTLLIPVSASDPDGTPVTITANFSQLSGAVFTTDRPPVVSAPTARTVAAMTPLTYTVAATDPDGEGIASLTATGLPAGATFVAGAGNATGTLSWTPSSTQAGSYSVTFTATNALRGSATTVITVINPDRGPVVTAPVMKTGAEGALLSVPVVATDPDGDAITSLSAAGTGITSGGVFSTGPGNANGTFSWTPTYAQAGTYSVTFTASNALSGSATTAITIANTNLAPVVSISTPASGSVFRVGTPVTFTGSFTDDAGDTHTASWKFDAITVAGVVNEGARSASATYTFATAGVYKVSLVVTDNSGASGTATTVGGVDATVVIYNPNGMVISGAGWINSPAGAYVPSPGSTGKGAFAFAVGYKIGASVPTGATSFEFKSGNMTLLSASCDWMVISGSRGQYKGSGKVNLAGSYGFLLTVIDGQVSGGGGIDKIRMKIWNKANGVVLYDTQPLASDNAAPTIALAGGAIAILPPGSAAAGINPTLADVEAAPAGFALLSNWPNPFNPETSIAYEVAEQSLVRVLIFDPRGRLVATLVSSVQEPGRHYAIWNGRASTGAMAASGIYFVRMDAGGYHAHRTVVLMK